MRSDVFKQFVFAWTVETTSRLDAVRVLEGNAVVAPSYRTFTRGLNR